MSYCLSRLLRDLRMRRKFLSLQNLQSSPRIMINEFLYFVLELFLQILAFVSRDAVNDKHSFLFRGVLRRSISALSDAFLNNTPDVPSLHHSQIIHRISDFTTARRAKRRNEMIYMRKILLHNTQNWSFDNSFVLHFNQLLIFVLITAFFHSNFMFIRF